VGGRRGKNILWSIGCVVSITETNKGAKIETFMNYRVSIDEIRNSEFNL
jgi:hypothetical protein